MTSYTNIAFGASDRITINFFVPQKMSVLTKPGAFHNLKISFIGFVYYFLPLFIAIDWLLKKVYEGKHCKVSVLTDFPEGIIEKNKKEFK